MKTVLISGSSVAGPAVAYWLRQNDFKPTIVERATAPRAGGQAIDIRGPALEVIKRIGILDAAHAMRTQMTGVSALDADGKEIWRSEEMTFSGGRFDNDDIELLRDDLSNLLLDKTSTGVEYIYGDTISALKQTDQHIHVTFQHEQPRTFDLVIGADGLHSKVRALVFGDEAQFLKPVGVSLAVFTTSNLLKLDNWQIAFRDKDSGYVVYPVRENTELRTVLGFKTDPHDDEKVSIEQQKALVAERCADLRWEIPRLLESMREADDFYFGAMAQVQMNRWSNGRVVLVGDAAYCPTPLSGQGTSLALVGSYILAAELARTPFDHSTAFRKYEERMRPYVTLNQALATRDWDTPVDEDVFNKAKNAISLDG